MRDMSNYEDNLRHVVRPDDMGERESSPSVVLHDYEALYLARALYEYAAYECETDGEYEGIALAFAEYVQRTVRDEGENNVVLYAHTPEARMVLADAIDAMSTRNHDLHAGVSDALHDLWREDDDA